MIGIIISSDSLLISCSLMFTWNILLSRFLIKYSLLLLETEMGVERRLDGHLIVVIFISQNSIIQIRNFSNYMTEFHEKTSI